MTNKSKKIINTEFQNQSLDIPVEDKDLSVSKKWKAWVKKTFSILETMTTTPIEDENWKIKKH